MPYITQDRRTELDAGRAEAKTAGELNYQITQLVRKYLRQAPKVNYGLLNEVVGALECAKLELYRRLVSPYEDEKITENGDVY